jgi:hypothetical protein
MIGLPIVHEHSDGRQTWPKFPRYSVGPTARDYEGAISEFQRNITAFMGGNHE